MAVVERDGALFNPDGIDVEALKAHIHARHSLAAFAGATYSPDGTKGLEYDCDILIPAACESVITHAQTPQGV